VVKGQTDGRELVRKLLAQGKLYDKEFETWTTEAKRIARRYRSETGSGEDSQVDNAAYFNLFWASLQTAIPSLYARTPIPQVDRRYKDKDPVARVAAEVLERALRYEVGAQDFDTQIQAAVLDRLLFGRGVCRVRYEPTFETINGVETKTRERVCLEYVQSQDFKHNTARTWGEVTQIRFRSYLSKAEAVEAFGKDIAGKLKYLYLPKGLDDDKTFSSQESTDFKKAEVWEVWDKPSRSVITISAECKDCVLKMQPDPLELEGFFPIAPPLYGTLTNDSLIPVPDARQCKRLYNLLDDIEAKIGALTEDLRVAGIYDASMEEVAKLQKGDKLIPVRNYAALKAAGGLAAAIEFWPVEHVTAALSVLYSQKEQTKGDIYEVTGWADIMRGASDPNETAAAQQLKGRFASIRLTRSQNDVQRFVRDCCALMGEIIAEQFEPATLVAMTGLEFVPGASPEEKKANYLQVVETLRNEPNRRFRIAIETDSTLALNEAVDQQARSEFMQSLVGGLQTLGPLMEQMPTAVPLLGEALAFTARSYKAGRAFEGAIEEFIETSKAAVVQKQKQPQQDPKALEAQAKLQLEQMKAQAAMDLEQAKAANEMQIAQAKQATEQQKAELKALQELEQTRNSILLEQARLDAEIRIQKAQAEADISIQAMKAQLDAAIAQQKEVINSGGQGGRGTSRQELVIKTAQPRRKRVTPTIDEETGKKHFVVEDADEDD